MGSCPDTDIDPLLLSKQVTHIGNNRIEDCHGDISKLYSVC